MAARPAIDLNESHSWHFPANFEERPYQHSMILQCLQKNCLVVLPKGAGKMLIASVAMYNFRRWYPDGGKICFIAPTRVDASQRLRTFSSLVEVDRNELAELNSSQIPTTREKLWSSKRYFFLTLDILLNDLANGCCPGTEIVCIVFYNIQNECIRQLYREAVTSLQNSKENNLHRILAFSSSLLDTGADIQNLVDSLRLSDVIFHSKSSPDIAPFLFRTELVLTKVDPIEPSNLLYHPKIYQVENSVLDIIGSDPIARIAVLAGNHDDAQHIARCLSQHSSLLKAMVYFGNYKQKPMATKQQLEILTKFYHGGYNLFVAAGFICENFDIARVGYIICCDTYLTPLLHIQLTGPLNGHHLKRVVQLIASGEEESRYRVIVAHYREREYALENASGLCRFWKSDILLPQNLFCKRRVFNLNGSGSTPMLLDAKMRSTSNPLNLSVGFEKISADMVTSLEYPKLRLRSKITKIFKLRHSRRIESLKTIRLATEAGGQSPISDKLFDLDFFMTNWRAGFDFDSLRAFLAYSSGLWLPDTLLVPEKKFKSFCDEIVLDANSFIENGTTFLNENCIEEQRRPACSSLEASLKFDDNSAMNAEIVECFEKFDMDSDLDWDTIENVYA